MRHKLVFATFLFVSLASSAAPLKVDDFYKKSDTLMKIAKTAKNEKEQTAQLLSLKESLEKTRTEYQNQDPDKGGPDESKVNLLYYNLLPVFDYIEDTKKNPNKCANTELKIRSADAQGRDEGAPLRKDAQIALDWLKIFCK
ncbi:hypothetical protein [Bdellovibrio sp. HCB2-146]|uniref:hypothetical protein n=1 Tax=Bdellovibrio sp. HCB2-146 TaxID=3394362 RepID=UPI0039BD7C3E